MSFINTIVIDGYTFKFIHNSADEGVLIQNLDTVDVNSIEFVSSLQKAFDLYQAQYKVRDVLVYQTQDYKDMYKYHLRKYDGYKRAKKALRNANELDEGTLELLRAFVASIEYPSFVPTLKPKKKRTRGYVYLAKDENNLYKIGKTKSPQKRLAALSLNLKKDITLVHTIVTDDYTQLERDFHNMFDGLRVHGEWFALAPHNVDQFKYHDRYFYAPMGVQHE